jgi:hypothetical protein
MTVSRQVVAPVLLAVLVVGCGGKGKRGSDRDPNADSPKVDKTKGTLHPRMGKYYENPGVVAYMSPEAKGWWETVGMGEKVRIHGRPFGINVRWVRVNQAVPYTGFEPAVAVTDLVTAFETDAKAAKQRYQGHVVIEGVVVGWDPGGNSLYLAAPEP